MNMNESDGLSLILARSISMKDGRTTFDFHREMILGTLAKAC